MSNGLLLPFVGNDLVQDLLEGFEGEGAQILTGAMTDGNGSVFDVLVTNDDHIGDLFHLRTADLVTQGVLTFVNGYAVFVLCQAFLDLCGVFKGSVGLSGGAINLAQDPKTEFLKTIATGSSLGYTLCGSAERDVILGNHSAVGSSIYTGLSEQIGEYMAQAQPLLDKVRTASIVSYEKNGNVSRTEFDNGVVLYVNYGLTAEQTELGALDGLSFRFH